MPHSVPTPSVFRSLSFSLQVDPSDGSVRCKVWFYGDQVDVETAALLIQATAKSALPFGFEYALDCDRLRPGEFGGGYVVIREDGLEFAGSYRLLDRAIARGHHEGVDGYGLVTRDAEAGLLFRSEEHTSELQSPMRISYVVFCLTKKKYTSI